MTDFAFTRKQDQAMNILTSDATNIALGGGSRSGKTFLFVRSIVTRALAAAESRHVIFRYRFNSVKQYIYHQTMPDVIKLCYPQLPSVESMTNKTDWYVEFPNGSQIWLGGLDDKERVEKILGGEYVTNYYNECSQIPYNSIVTANTRLAQKVGNMKLRAYYDFNPPSKKHWTYRMFVEKMDPIKKAPLRSPMNYAYFMMNPQDNIENLNPAYLEHLESLPDKAKLRFLYGQFGDETDGQLWTDELISHTRRMDDLPQWLRITVNVDPSGTTGDEDSRSDEVGITVTALGTDGHGYLLEDLSGNYRPEEWADIVNEAYDRHQADLCVGEVNYGGDMVRAVLQAKNPNLPFKAVVATRGKIIRAEPISALYELNKIHHVGLFPEIEDQLCAMLTSGYTGLKSPDRADSAIWGFTELFPGMTKRDASKVWTPPTVHKVERNASRYDIQRKANYDRRF